MIPFQLSSSRDLNLFEAKAEWLYPKHCSFLGWIKADSKQFLFHSSLWALFLHPHLDLTFIFKCLEWKFTNTGTMHLQYGQLWVDGSTLDWLTVASFAPSWLLLGAFQRKGQWQCLEYTCSGSFLVTSHVFFLKCIYLFTLHPDCRPLPLLQRESCNTPPHIAPASFNNIWLVLPLFFIYMYVPTH